MILLAAMMMAGQLAGSSTKSQPTPALTVQQKQELSSYNFKGAEAQLQAQADKPATKPDPLAPVPLLKVPPLATLARQHSSG